MSFNWECPYCGRAQTVVDNKISNSRERICVGGNAEGNIAYLVTSIGCANVECQRVTVNFSISSINNYDGGYWEFKKNTQKLYSRRLLPSSFAKPQPDCVPSALVEDYTEACLIRDDSPKAAATLARRCIQGMIRDFCGIAKGTLAKEIEALKAALAANNAPQGVTHETVEAIDHVRSIGNIGAHMEKDIDLIIPVEPEEAQLLIGLIEMLFEEWYVARDTRQKKLAAISQLGAAKQQIKDSGKGKAPLLLGPSAGEA